MFRDTLHEMVEKALSTTADINQVFAYFETPGQKSQHKTDKCGKLPSEVWKVF